jgi:hypothetical protein
MILYNVAILRRATKSTPAFVGSPTAANCRLPSTGPTSAINRPDVCRQRARQNLHPHSLGARHGKLLSAVNGPDVCRQRARQNLHRHSLGARRWQIVVCRQRARHLPSTGPMSAINVPDKIYTYIYWEPDSGKLLYAVNGPDICSQRARCLPSTHPTNQFKQIMQCLPLTGPTSAIDRLDVCCQGARHLPPTCTMSAINWLKICYPSA